MLVLGELGQGPRGVGDQGGQLGAIGLGRPQLGDVGRPHEVGLDHRSGRLDGQHRGQEPNRLGGACLAGDQPVPDLGHGHPAGERGGQRPAAEDGASSGVRPGCCEGQVVVVDQVRVGRRQLDCRAGPLHLDRDERRANERGTVVAVRADCHHLRARRTAVGAMRHEHVLVEAEPVGAGCLQPAGHPRAQVTPARRAQGGDQVGQRRVAPGVPGEVVGHPGGEVGLAEVGHQLVQH